MSCSPSPPATAPPCREQSGCRPGTGGPSAACWRRTPGTGGSHRGDLRVRAARPGRSGTAAVPLQERAVLATRPHVRPLLLAIQRCPAYRAAVVTGVMPGCSMSPVNTSNPLPCHRARGAQPRFQRLVRPAGLPGQRAHHRAHPPSLPRHRCAARAGRRPHWTAARADARSSSRGERDAHGALPRRLHAVRPMDLHITRSLTALGLVVRVNSV